MLTYVCLLVFTGQQVFTQPFIEYPELMQQLDAAQMQQMQLVMEMLQQQQQMGAVVSSQSLQMLQVMTRCQGLLKQTVHSIKLSSLFCMQFGIQPMMNILMNV
jgi:formylmethanofuran dehydrogenase subunit A